MLFMIQLLIEAGREETPPLRLFAGIEILVAAIAHDNMQGAHDY
jgi:hypothetical protein